MMYEKPQLVVLGRATDVVQGGGKPDCIDDSEDKLATCGAYETDE
jgi:hypothetical protein